MQKNTTELNSYCYKNQLMGSMQGGLMAQPEQNGLQEIKSIQNNQFIAVSAAEFMTIFASLGTALLTYRRVLPLEHNNRRLQTRSLISAQIMTHLRAVRFNCKFNQKSKAITCFCSIYTNQHGDT